MKHVDITHNGMHRADAGIKANLLLSRAVGRMRCNLTERTMATHFFRIRRNQLRRLHIGRLFPKTLTVCVVRHAGCGIHQRGRIVEHTIREVRKRIRFQINQAEASADTGIACRRKRAINPDISAVIAGGRIREIKRLRVRHIVIVKHVRNHAALRVGILFKML